ncbi:DUF2461 family protein [Pseudonocardia sp.]|uniref:DUF2461 family protein n=1 Tax=Pseudonocardia sp. TaxID=60912 RepID=UPI003D0BC484
MRDVGVTDGATVVASGFRGWPADATAFLTELAADNTAQFWSAERHRHTEAVLPPLRALAAELAAEFGELRIFRPYRDRRFRPDAPPYRCDAGGVCHSAGGTARAVVLSGSALTVEVGRFAFDGPALQAYRAALGGAGAAPVDGATAGPGAAGTGPGRDVDPTDAAGTAVGARLAAILADLAARCVVPDDARLLTRTPRGVPATHPHADLLRRRALLVRRSWPAGEWLGTREPLHRVREAWRAAEPLVAWLDEIVGPA